MAGSDAITAQAMAIARKPLPKRLMWAAAFAAVAGALVLGWPWLTAIGAASVLISVLPCAAMCALGLCMNRGRGHSCHGTATKPSPDGDKP